MDSTPVSRKYAFLLWAAGYVPAQNPPPAPTDDKIKWKLSLAWGDTGRRPLASWPSLPATHLRLEPCWRNVSFPRPLCRRLPSTKPFGSLRSKPSSPPESVHHQITSTWELLPPWAPGKPRLLSAYYVSGCFLGTFIHILSEFS